MVTKKIMSVIAVLAFMAAFAVQPVFAGHAGNSPCPMQHEKSGCKGKSGKCPMMEERVSKSRSMDRTAGSTPVYGAKKGCCKKACDMPCCKGKTGKCPMKHVKKAGVSGAHDGHKQHGAHKQGVHAGHVAADMTHGGPEAKALDGVMAKMHRDMAVPYTGDADADFIRGMIPHHQGAIDMARVVLEYGNDPDAQQLARNIIRAQKGEIAWMKRWLERRQIPATDPINLNQ